MEKEIKYSERVYLGAAPKGDVRRCYIDIELRQETKGLELSMVGTLKSSRGEESGGQNYDNIKEYYKGNKKVQRMVKVWKRWHLNGMNAGCEHQRKNWDMYKKIIIYTYKLKSGISHEQGSIEEESIDRLKEGYSTCLNEHECKILSLKYELKGPKLKGELLKYYELKGEEKKAVNSIPPTGHKDSYSGETHPDGILCKVCEVCGYKYGSTWLHEELPKSIIAEVKTW